MTGTGHKARRAASPAPSPSLSLGGCSTDGSTGEGVAMGNGGAGVGRGWLSCPTALPVLMVGAQPPHCSICASREAPHGWSCWEGCFSSTCVPVGRQGWGWGAQRGQSPPCHLYLGAGVHGVHQGGHMVLLEGWGPAPLSLPKGVTSWQPSGALGPGGALQTHSDLPPAHLALLCGPSVRWAGVPGQGLPGGAGCSGSAGPQQDLPSFGCTLRCPSPEVN